MRLSLYRFVWSLCCLVSMTVRLSASVHTATVNTAVRTEPEKFQMGTALAPNGSAVTVSRDSLLIDGEPCTPVMGEFHFSRYPANEWREELLKMKAGGITIVSTYVFWIYHEEVEGEWEWTDRRNLHQFVETAGSLGLKVIVRCGPWCHGEVRNGGFPDWLLQKGWKLRSDDPPFIDQVRTLYTQISKQLSGLLWKDGGPVIGIQVDNEFNGPAEYLLALKKIAREVDLDVPLYTRTGWPQLTTPIPFGEIVPLYGSYAEGFWDRELTSMPGAYKNAFHFSTLRIDENIANEQLGHRNVRDAADVTRYPYLTCEIGGGMMNSYHRRILIDPVDVESTTLVKIGSGSTLPGYYMYHGGTNPDGKLTTLMEAQNTALTNYNDLPVKNYDFQAPLGEFGQIRPQYHLLRRLHLFLADFGQLLPQMAPTMPDATKDQSPEPLRWSVRSDGRSGFVFVNNYERGRSLPAQSGVQFRLTLPAGAVTFPSVPMDIPSNRVFFWPFNFDLGSGVKLSYATAQPICAVENGDERTIFFAETSGIPAQFSIAGEAQPRTVSAGREPAFRIAAEKGKTVQIVLLSEIDSLALWKGKWNGQDRVFLTQAGLVIDQDTLRLSSSHLTELSVGVYPALKKGKQDGVFVRYTPPVPQLARSVAKVIQIQTAGEPRIIPVAKTEQPMAMEPTDEDFAKAAVWRVELPADLDLTTNPILRFHYVGDVARITLNGKLLNDDFYNGSVFDFGLRRNATGLPDADLRIAILPLRKDAIEGTKQRIFMADTARPNFGHATSIAEIKSVEIIPNYTVTVTGEN